MADSNSYFVRLFLLAALLKNLLACQVTLLIIRSYSRILRRKTKKQKNPSKQEANFVRYFFKSSKLWQRAEEVQRKYYCDKQGNGEPCDRRRLYESSTYFPCKIKTCIVIVIIDLPILRRSTVAKKKHLS